ncbi:hypothetical protein Acr_23g0010900 [Actinidia rufa]|uniref:Reverse transcriptase domain-containing protein n=1 Tax=Actinidia rufa TaxID=165716 RepID=A0A7J0GPG7_9ERIC|nr:hypothetical protein Acr_23g0010900 [Actinidia rufa]
MAMMKGLRSGPFFDSLSKNVLVTMSMLQIKAGKYIAAKESAEAKQRRRGRDDHKRNEPNTQQANYRDEIDDAEMEALRDEVEEITFADPRGTKNTKPLEVVAPISIHPDHPDRYVMIGTELTEEQRNALVEFLKKNSDVFAWSQGDVPGIGPQVAVHKLFTNTILQESHYPDWLTNIIIALQKGRKWRVCVDFTDLNKACPKDSFPLTKIDLIADATSKHELLNFMDAFSGYHQIKMHPPDVKKTSFITERGLYYYKVYLLG